VIEPDAGQANFLRQHKLNHVQTAITPENYREVLGGLLEPGKGFCVNLSVDTSSLDLMKLLPRDRCALYRHGGGAMGGLLFRHHRQRGAHQLCARQTVRDEKARQPRRDDGGLLLRGKPRHGQLVREGGPVDAGQGYRPTTTDRPRTAKAGRG
jgi:homospermidine synthase